MSPYFQLGVKLAASPFGSSPMSLDPGMEFPVPKALRDPGFEMPFPKNRIPPVPMPSIPIKPWQPKSWAQHLPSTQSAIASANPYGGSGGVAQFGKDLATLTGIHLPPKTSIPKPPTPPTGGKLPTPAQPPSPGINVPGAAAATMQPEGHPSNAYFGQLAAKGTGWLGALGANMAGKHLPYGVQEAVNFNPGRTWAMAMGKYPNQTWGQYLKSRIPLPFIRGTGAPPTPPTAWAQAVRNIGQEAAAAPGLAGKIGPRFINLAKISGPITTPLNAGMEVLDAAGALPQMMGGTGIGNPGWSADQDFQRFTTIGGPGDNLFGYSGPGWQGLNYLGSSLNSFNKPLRSVGTVAFTGPKEIGTLLGQGMKQTRQIDAAKQQLADAKNLVPFTPEQLNQMAKNRGDFYFDEQLGHAMPKSEFMWRGNSPADEAWRQRVLARAGSLLWRPAE